MKEFINKAIVEDAIEVMHKIPDNSIDVTFADPRFDFKK